MVMQDSEFMKIINRLPKRMPGFQAPGNSGKKTDMSMLVLAL
jgi:hypothetical protein